MKKFLIFVIIVAAIVAVAVFIIGPEKVEKIATDDRSAEQVVEDVQESMEPLQEQMNDMVDQMDPETKAKAREHMEEIMQEDNLTPEQKEHMRKTNPLYEEEQQQQQQQQQ